MSILLKKAGIFLIIIVLIPTVLANVQSNQILYIKGSSGGGNPFDQGLNTTEDVDFLGVEIGKGVYYGETGLGGNAFETYLDLQQTNKYTYKISFIGSNDDVLPPFDDDTSDTHYIEFDTKNDEMTFFDGDGASITLDQLSAPTNWGSWTENPATNDLNINNKNIIDVNQLNITNNLIFETIGTQYNINTKATDSLKISRGASEICSFDLEGIHCTNLELASLNENVFLQSNSADQLEINISNTDVCTFNETSINCLQYYGDGSGLTGISNPYVPPHQPVNTTDNVTFNKLNINNLLIEESNDNYTFTNLNTNAKIKFNTYNGTHNLSLMSVDSKNPQIYIGNDDYEINPGLQGLLRLGGKVTSGFITGLLNFNPEVTGASVVSFLVQPNINSTGVFQLFRYTPVFLQGNDHASTLIFFSPSGHLANYNDDFHLYQENGVTRTFNAISADDKSTVDYDWLTMGGQVNLFDIGSKNVNYTENMISLYGGGNRFAGQNGFIRQKGLIFNGFGNKINLVDEDYVIALEANGGDYLFKDNSYIEHNGTMNQTQGTSLINVPHIEMWNTTENGYAFTISSLNTWYNITGLMLDENQDFTKSGQGVIPSYDGTYKASWDMSFSGSGGSTHSASLSINGIEHSPCRNYRKLGTAGDVGAFSKSCEITLTAGDNVTMVIKDIITPAQNINIWAVNMNIQRVSK